MVFNTSAILLDNDIIRCMQVSHHRYNILKIMILCDHMHIEFRVRMLVKLVLNSEHYLQEVVGPRDFPVEAI